MISVRRFRVRKQLALTMVATMALSGAGPLILATATVHAQAAAVGQGFVVDAGDVRFIYQQILVAQAHAAGGTLLGNGPNQVADPQLPRGLRTVDGSYNNLVPIPDQHLFGKADLVFPRLTTPVYRTAEALSFDPDGPGGQAAGQATTYTQKKGFVSDSQPRLITNLIVDQSPANPAAVAAATNPCGSGGFVCSGTADPDPDTGALFIPNITPDFGLSAPFNLMFAFFGQFFDHGLDLVTKGGGTVVMPLRADDPLFDAGVDGVPFTIDDGPNFMVMTRGQNQPGPDGVLGDNPATTRDESADDIQEAMNTTTPWVDQNQTYTSHPSHQVFLRQYAMVNGRPVPDGKVLDGGACSVRANTPLSIGGTVDEICNIGNWREVKQQAAAKLGIQLTDQDVLDVPLILTDPYGHFKPGRNGFPQIVLPGNALLEGDPAANGNAGVAIPANALRTGHAFLNDIAHSAVPTAAGPDLDGDIGGSLDVHADGRYDNELLDEHFVTGDGRGNENIALTMVHNLFHAEHNRLVHYIDQVIHRDLTGDEVTAWETVDARSGWGYGERLFQAARFVTEMEYQHLVFEEFARTIQPLINPFLGGITSINGAISAEFAHTVYRLGHSMLPERVARINADGSDNGLRLFTAFLNPVAYNDGGSAGPLNAAQAAGSLIRGLSREVGNELDEFVTSSVRNTLVGLPLDLAAINIARGRSEGIPPLNEARRQFYNATRDAAVRPYANWFEFGLALRHHDSLVNFVAAYGTDPTIRDSGPDGIAGNGDDVTTVAAKRAAAQLIVNGNLPLMTASPSTSGLNNVDFWVGGLAEKPAVFGGLLGSTFNFVFERQLERLQDGDRFYYLQRTDGLNLRFSLEGNSLAELARRNTDVGATMDIIFNTADFMFDPSSPTGTDLGGGITLLALTDGTTMFFDPLHTGKNIVFSGGSGPDRFRADVGDDSLFGFDGNDRFDGGEGNDTLNGGAGDDVLLGENGDDVVKGGPGNDAAHMGPGFGADLAIGGEGNDFLVGGDDGVEYFGGPGNDVIADGAMRSEGIFGGDGDDWLYDGDGHDGGMFGDGGNVFDLLAGLDFVGGDDVEGGGPGQDNHFGEGGDDIMLMSEGSNKFFGDYGFDWITQRSWAAPAVIEMDLLAIPGLPLNFNDLRNFYRFVDGASGWDLDDSIKGDNNTADPAAPLELLLQPHMELTVAGAAKITGLTALMGPTGFNQPLPFIGGNILLGGLGSDTIRGGGGRDLIDGDRWLNVQLEGTLTGVTPPKRANDPRELIEDVFSDPQRLNPGNIRIVREIVTPTGVPAADCGVDAPLNCDTAVFDGPQAAFVITKNANGSITVFHVAGAGKFGQVGGIAKNDETDTLLNIEQLRFDDGIVDTATLTVSAAPTGPVVTGQVVVNSSLAVNTLTSPALTIAPNTLVVALVSADGTTARPSSVTGVTNTAPRGTTTLPWTRAVAAGGQPGTAEVWWAYSTTGQTNTTVRARLNRANPGSMTVMTFANASPSLVGAVTPASLATGVPTATLTTTGGSSLILAVGTDQGAAGLMTPAAGQQIVNQFQPTGGDTYWVQRTSATVPTSGTTVTVASTPSGTRGPWNLALIEIRRQ
ncbi:MAG: heme peroxidase [Acidobacteria bacterium]|nr:MAG: heme peroxidase [Acidobacteriota bacterium]